MTCKSEPPGQRGFTLIEFLIVISVIGLIAAVLMPLLYTSDEDPEILSRKDWRCAKTERREYSYPMYIGKVMTVQKGHRDECVSWERIPK